MEAIVASIVGALALWVGYRRLAQASALASKNHKVTRTEQMLREALDVASGPNRWRPARDTDAEVVALLKVAATDERHLVELGFRIAGDLIAEHHGRSVVMRSFVNGPAGAGLAISTAAPDRVRLAISSYAADTVFRTIRGYEPWFARPPFKHIQHTRADATAAVVVRDHSTFAKADGLRTLATLDDVLAAIADEHEREQRWRNAEPPDALLDADLRGLLGARYAKSGRYWAAKLRGKLPDATLRRR